MLHKHLKIQSSSLWSLYPAKLCLFPPFTKTNSGYLTDDCVFSPVFLFRAVTPFHFLQWYTRRNQREAKLPWSATKPFASLLRVVWWKLFWSVRHLSGVRWQLPSSFANMHSLQTFYNKMEVWDPFWFKSLFLLRLFLGCNLVMYNTFSKIFLFHVGTCVYFIPAVWLFYKIVQRLLTQYSQ